MLKIRLRKDGKPDRRVQNRETKLARLMHFLREPRTVDDCVRELRVYRRTVYFLMEELTSRGKTVARVGKHTDGRFVLLGRSL